MGARPSCVRKGPATWVIQRCSKGRRPVLNGQFGLTQNCSLGARPEARTSEPSLTGVTAQVKRPLGMPNGPDKFTAVAANEIVGKGLTPGSRSRESDRGIAADYRYPGVVWPNTGCCPMPACKRGTVARKYGTWGRKACTCIVQHMHWQIKPASPRQKPARALGNFDDKPVAGWPRPARSAQPVDILVDQRHHQRKTAPPK